MLMRAMPARKRRRSPLLASVLLVLALVLMTRSLWLSDALAWQSIRQQSESIIQTSLGLRTSHLGIGLFYDESLISARNARALNAVVSSMQPGLHFSSEPAHEPATLWPRAGFAFDRRLDERPEHFQNSLEMMIPLWLIAMLLAISPTRWLLAPRAAARETARKAASPDLPPRNITSKRRSDMRIAVIALVCGLIIGGLVMFLVTRHVGKSGAAPQAVVDDGKPPIHAIVGSWRLRIDSIVA